MPPSWSLGFWLVLWYWSRDFSCQCVSSPWSRGRSLFVRPLSLYLLVCFDVWLLLRWCLGLEREDLDFRENQSRWKNFSWNKGWESVALVWWSSSCSLWHDIQAFSCENPGLISLISFVQWLRLLGLAAVAFGLSVRWTFACWRMSCLSPGHVPSIGWAAVVWGDVVVVSCGTRWGKRPLSGLFGQMFLAFEGRCQCREKSVIINCISCF